MNVTDLDLGLRFWSEVTGWEELGAWHGWLGYLGTREPDRVEMILNVTTVAPVALTEPDHHQANRVHIDIWPENGMDSAVAEIIAIGGALKKAPSLYPRPGSYGDDPPRIDWAVMQDPFGNEFCIVELLTREQSSAAMESGATDAHALRVAAGVTPADG